MKHSRRAAVVHGLAGVRLSFDTRSVLVVSHTYSLRNELGFSAVQVNILSNDGTERSFSVAGWLKLAKIG